MDESSSKIDHPRNGSASAVAGCVTHANTRPGPVRRVGPGTRLARLAGLAAHAQPIGRKAEAAGVHPPAPVPLNIIKAKRCWSSKMGFSPRLLTKKPFELFENTRSRGRQWLKKSAPRQGARAENRVSNCSKRLPGQFENSVFASGFCQKSMACHVLSKAPKLSSMRCIHTYPHIPISAHPNLRILKSLEDPSLQGGRMTSSPLRGPARQSGSSHLPGRPTSSRSSDET